MMPALSACTSSPVPAPGDNRDVGRPDDVDLVLADADRLDDDDVLAGGVEDERGIAGRAREAAEMPARRHAADEHPSSAACDCIRSRSPRTAPPVNGTGRIHGYHSNRWNAELAELAERLARVLACSAFE
jgi:hypothetical protein